MGPILVVIVEASTTVDPAWGSQIYTLGVSPGLRVNSHPCNVAAEDWAAVEELVLGSHSPEAISCTIYPYYDHVI